ncbi:hypothetical protein H6758_01615 [Candidatus Nomurabacteria bacterium]|nr:hypothetical protein [Candidatus Nomurabacteria bacterium]
MPVKKSSTSKASKTAPKKRTSASKSAKAKKSSTKPLAKKKDQALDKKKQLEQKIHEDIEVLKKDIELAGASKVLKDKKKELSDALGESVELEDLVAKMHQSHEASTKELATQAKAIKKENAQHQPVDPDDEVSADVRALWYDAKSDGGSLDHKAMPEPYRADGEHGFDSVHEVGDEKEKEVDRPTKRKIKKSHKMKQKSEEKVESISLKHEKIEEKLSKIYKNKDGSIPDMKHFKKRRGGRFFRALFTLIFSGIFVAGVVYAGLFYLTPHASFAPESVILEIEGSEIAPFGGDVRYRIRYRNTSSVGLDNVVLQVKYPEGFVYRDASVHQESENHERFDIGFLQGYEGGFIDIFGRMYGDVGKSQSIRAFINYIPVNFSSEFQKVDSLNIEVANPEYNLEVAMPTEVVAGDIVEAQVSFSDLPENVSLEQLYLRVVQNDAFLLQSANLEEVPFNKGKFSLSSLGEDKMAKISGVFVNPEESGETELVFELLGTSGQSEHNGEYVYASKILPITVLETDMVSRLVINGATKQLDVQPGEMLASSIFLQNEGKTQVDNVEVYLRFDTPSFDEKSMLSWADLIDDRDGEISGEQVNENTRRAILKWDKSTVPEFLTIEPGDEVILDVSIPVRNIDQIELSEFSTYEIIANLEVQYEVDGETEILTQKPLMLTVNSDLGIEVLHEIEEEQLVHTMSWVLSNHFHELSNVQVEADIYGDITWLDDELSVPAGEVQFDPETQKVLWNMETFPLGVDVLALQFAFQNNVDNPTQTNLTSKINVRAVDSITGKEILLVVDGVKLGSEPEEEDSGEVDASL